MLALKSLYNEMRARALGQFKKENKKKLHVAVVLDINLVIMRLWVVVSSPAVAKNLSFFPNF